MASLKPTARKFVQKAFGELEPKIPGKEAQPGLMPRWESAGAEVFVLRQPVLSPEEWCLIDEVRHLTDLRETKLLEEALRHDSRVRPLLGTLVGTPLSSAQVEEEVLGRELLWAVMRAGNTSLRFSDDAFDRGYDAWLTSILASTQEGVVLAPISLRLDGHLDLGGGIEIVQLEDEELSACLSMGAVRLTLPTPGSDTAWVKNRAAVRVAFELPRGPTESFSEEDRANAFALERGAAARADDVIEALRVFQRGRVAYWPGSAAWRRLEERRLLGSTPSP